MPYNRTHQEKGKAAAIKPVSQWIIAVGLHNGLIKGSEWIKVQNLLNKKI